VKFLILASGLFLCMASCTKPDAASVTSSIPVPKPPGKLDHKQVPELLLTLNTEATAGQGKMDKNLFGRFFCDRAEFYVIKNPKNQVFSSPATSITLYYLDSELRQAKYILERDISSSLLHDLGNFRITGLNERNREIINQREILIRTNDGLSLNQRLDNVELRWTFGDREIIYRRCAGSVERFVYREKVKSYEKEFKAIEKYCI
jgi:hypothetical protein